MAGDGLPALPGDVEYERGDREAEDGVGDWGAERNGGGAEDRRAGDRGCEPTRSGASTGCSIYRLTRSPNWRGTRQRRARARDRAVLRRDANAGRSRGST